MLGDTDKEMFGSFMSYYYLLVSCGTGGFVSSPNLRGNARHFENFGRWEGEHFQHDINIGASSIHKVIIFWHQKNWV